MRRHTKRIIYNTFLAICIAITVVLLIRRKIKYDIGNSNDPYDNFDENIYVQRGNINTLKRIDWHDRAAMKADQLKIGLGEQGKPAYLSKMEKLNETILFSQNGFNALLSDKISLFRSVPDIRHPGCNTIDYISELPFVSVIIIFYNEHWSTLLRSIYSVLTKSPEQLIYEIILVDDGSEKEFLGQKLDNYVAKNLAKVKIVRHKKRKGLIAARLSGAKIAKAEVLIFLDSHIEANYNWLPPLLEPIAYNHKVAVCPFIDLIDHDTFEYRSQDEGARGAFDWEFHYKRLPLLPENLKDPKKPFRSPVMAGGLFAINRKWFWKLGGYDPELDIWGGEQYELSFKIWMCGGELLDVPCSRVGHVYRGNMISKNPRKNDFVHRNYKRVAEVWMDKYAHFLYDRDRKAFDAVDAGDISHRKAIRKKLHCKSFDWFMEKIAFDVFKYYPPVEPPSYAYGTIRSIANKNYCLDSLNHASGAEPGLYKCHDKAAGNQNWELSWHKDIKLREVATCLDVPFHNNNAKILLNTCHGRQGNQYWFYNHHDKFLVQGIYGHCMEANIITRKVYINECDKSNINMKWEFGFYNRTGLKNFHLVPPQL